MAASVHTISILFSLSYVHTISIFLSPVSSLHFNLNQFDSRDRNVQYEGDAAPSVGAVNFNYHQHYINQVGRAIYRERLQLWDSDRKKLADFTTRFSFSIDTNAALQYGHGVAFFLAATDFQFPVNSGGGFLGLYNVTNAFSYQNQIVTVEFDTHANYPEWDPPFEHVGINNNSIKSSNYVPWNVSFHSGDTADVLIDYNATSKNLTVSWNYRSTQNDHENSSLFYQIDLSKVLPEWVIIGFSAATGQFQEQHELESWEFSSTLDVEENHDRNDENKLILGIAVPSAVLIVACTVLIAFAVTSYRRRRRSETETAHHTSINDDLERGAGPRRFSYGDLALATNNFSADRKLGQGGFGAVYRGYIMNLDMAVAVKKISRGSKQGKKEYITEVKIISRLRHRNLVQLVGWCHDDGEFLLVYEFMPNGSLDTHLSRKRVGPPLTWAIRYKISLGLASALLYLHEEWEQCVIHRDIKSSNIMLDSSFNVKLGDFGLARLMDHELGLHTTGLAGTLGYMAPEYVNTGRASKESDVYSFGVVVLEIVTGRRSRDAIDESSEMGLVQWVWDLHGRGDAVGAVDGRLKMEFDGKQVECLVMVGLWCAHPDRCLRPSIRQAIQVLNFETTWPDLPAKMPVAIYCCEPSKPLVISSEEAQLSCTSMEVGR